MILQIDFGNEALASTGLDHLTQMLRAQPTLHCIILAEHGSELSAVRALKCGAKDYLPLARITRDSLLQGRDRSLRQAARRGARPRTRCSRPPSDTPSIQRARLHHRQGDRHQQFLLGVPRPQRAAAAQRGAQGDEPRHLRSANSTTPSASSASTRSSRASRIAPSRRSTTSARCRSISTSPWNTSPAATCAIGCATP